MSDKRFPPIPLESMTAEQRAVADDLMKGPRGGIRGPFAALLRNPALTTRVVALGTSVRFENSLPAALREFAILITARFWTARYEWHAHGKIAMDLGVRQDTVTALGAGKRPPQLTEEESLVYRFVVELLYDKDISDAAYDAVLSHFGELTTLDLMVTVGYFGFVSAILNGTRHPLPADATPLPDFSGNPQR